MVGMLKPILIAPRMRNMRDDSSMVWKMAATRLIALAVPPRLSRVGCFDGSLSGESRYQLGPERPSSDGRKINQSCVCGYREIDDELEHKLFIS